MVNNDSNNTIALDQLFVLTMISELRKIAEHPFNLTSVRLALHSMANKLQKETSLKKYSFVDAIPLDSEGRSIENKWSPVELTGVTYHAVEIRIDGQYSGWKYIAFDIDTESTYKAISEFITDVLKRGN